MKLIAHNSCLIFKVQQEIGFATFETESYDVESNDATIGNILNTNSEGKVTYSVSLVTGGSADSIATIDRATGKLTIKNGTKGHIKVTATIAPNGDFEQLTASYLVDVYKLYKAGEEIDCTKEDFSQSEFQNYSGGYLYTGSNKAGQSVRVYHIPAQIYKNKVAIFQIKGYENYPDSELALGYASDVFIKEADTGRERSSLPLRQNKNDSVIATCKNIAETSGQVKIIRWPEEKWGDIELKYMFIQASVNDFPSNLYLSTVDDIKDYGDYDL